MRVELEIDVDPAAMYDEAMRNAAIGIVALALIGCGGSVTSGGGGKGGEQGTTTGTTTVTTSTTTTSATTTSSTTTTTPGGCDATTCQSPFTCCGDACVYTDNDVWNCGGCGNACAAAPPFCDHGICGKAPCSGQTCLGGETCCGDQCCGAGQICCNVQLGGPVGPLPICTTPENGTCPKGCPLCVCASPLTPIATPGGDRAIADLRPGDLVYSVDHDAVVVVPVSRVNRAPVEHHHVVRVSLANGAVLEVSPRHPTADGRTFGDLRAGGSLDGVRIVAAELIPYRFDATYDILPASDTGTYYAGGARVGSTLGDRAP